MGNQKESIIQYIGLAREGKVSVLGMWQRLRTLLKFIPGCPFDGHLYRNRLRRPSSFLTGSRLIP